MSRHRTVDIAVPNMTAARAVAIVRLDRTDPTQLADAGLELPAGELDVIGYGLLLDDVCSEPELEGCPPELEVALEPFETRHVRAVIKTADTKKAAVAVFGVTDTRDGNVVGGVSIVCVEPEYPPDTPAAVAVDPSPVTLAEDLYTVALGDDPGVVPDVALPRDQRLELVAVVTNPTRTDLNDVLVCLEHVGGVPFTPQTWHVGALEAGGSFWATWPLEASAAAPGRYEASIVVRDNDHEPTRIHAPFRNSHRGDDGSAGAAFGDG
ncbi:MAG TPA: hypothetical protein VFA94_15630 [Acidimicrobiales bacterium]|nr:hypothetical protein [Acidimicrobiales bacterium]